MKKIFFILFVSAIAFSVSAQTKKTPATKKTAVKKAKGVGDFEMKQYFMVFLKSGPNRTQDSVTVAKIQEGHLAHLTKMYNEGKTDLAGPFMDKGDIRGICVYNVATIEEVKKLTELDPAVISGRLIVEIHPWYAAKGSVLK
ncbi:MAG: hypothetical protein IAF38_12950 [Bacteroidia bacterium]|nr:hypothetical protein [Bacteroidia bacterium]